MQKRLTVGFDPEIYEYLKHQAALNRRTFNQELQFALECVMAVSHSETAKALRLAYLVQEAPSLEHIGTDEPGSHQEAQPSFPA